MYSPKEKCGNFWCWYDRWRHHSHFSKELGVKYLNWGPASPEGGRAEVGIYKRKQETKKIKKESTLSAKKVTKKTIKKKKVFRSKNNNHFLSFVYSTKLNISKNEAKSLILIWVFHFLLDRERVFFLFFLKSFSYNSHLYSFRNKVTLATLSVSKCP